MIEINVEMMIVRSSYIYHDKIALRHEKRGERPQVRDII